MNERIQELAEQAWDTPIDEMGEVISEDGQYSWDFHRATEKFAELIVRECIDIISPYAIRMENFDGGHPVAEIKKHFGVE